MFPWKLGISTADESPNSAPILLNGTLEENLRAAARLGYDAIEVHTREDIPHDIEAAKKAMTESGAFVAMVISGRLNTEGQCSMSSDIPYVSAAAEAGMREYIDLAAQLDAGVVVGWTRGRATDAASRRRALTRMGLVMRRLNGYARERDVLMHIETLNRYETNLLNTVDEIIDFIEDNQLSQCRVHADIFHMNIEERDLISAIRRAGEYLGYVHLADNNRGPCGSGSLDFRSILGALDDAGYRGVLTVECLPRPDGPEAARESVEFLRKIMDKTG